MSDIEMTSEVSLQPVLIPVIRIINPFDPRDRVYETLVWEPTKSMADYFPIGTVESVVSISGKIVELEDMASTYLDRTDSLVICPVPQGGGSGDGGKSILRIVAMVAISVLAPYATTAMLGIGGAAAVGGLGVSMFTVGVTLAGALLVNALLPPAKSTHSSSASSSDTTASTSYGIDGAKNTSIEGMPVPVCYGAYRMAGNVLSMFVENDGKTQSLYMLMNAGEGPVLSLTDVRVNNQPLTSYKQVSAETRDGSVNQPVIAWFADTKTPHAIGRKLTTDVYVTYETDAVVDQLRFDVVFPQGMGITSLTTGVKSAASVGLQVQFRKKGTSEWAGCHNSAITGYRPLFTFTAPATLATYDEFGSFAGFSGQPAHSVTAEGALRPLQVGQVSPYTATGPGGMLQDGAIPGFFFSENPDNVYSQALTDEQGGQLQVGSFSRQIVYADGDILVTESSTSPVRRSYFSGNLESGIYEVRARRTTPHSEAIHIQDEVILSDVVEITTDDVSYANTALVAIKIQLDDQISGVPNVTFMNGGRLINAFDFASNTWVSRASNNPAWIVLDALTHQRYGAAMSYSRFDIEMFKEWAQYCENSGMTFNAVVDTSMNVWDAMQPVLRCGHAQIVNVGTRFTVVIERAGAPSMMFGVGNIIEGSFKQSWLGLKDRANEIDVTFYDKDDDYKPRTVKVSDQYAAAAGEKQRPSAITLMGVIDKDRAYKEGLFQLNLNRFVQQSVEFSAPIEAIACTVGDLVYVQHDMPQWGFAGRIDIGSAANAAVLDRPVTIEAGKQYKLLINYDAVLRNTGSIASVIGDSLILSNYDGSENVKRIKSAGIDRAVLSSFSSGSGTFGIVVDGGSFGIGASYELWDTDVIEERDVVNIPGQGMLLTPMTPFSSAPEQYANWMFGEVTKVRKPFRIRSVHGSHDYKREISCIEYNASCYDLSGAPALPANYSSLSLVVEQVIIDGVTEAALITAGNPVVNVTISFYSKQESYAGSLVKASLNGKAFETITANALGSASLYCQAGDVVIFKVIAKDLLGFSAPENAAPTLTYTVGSISITAPDVTGLTVVASGQGFLASWDRPSTARLQAWDFTRVSIGATKEAATVLFTGKTTSFNLGWLPAGIQKVWVDHGNSTGKWSTPASVSVTVAPPAQPILQVQVWRNQVTLSWQNCLTGQPISHYIVQNSSHGILTELARVNASTYTRSEPVSGSYLYYVTAFDVAGNPSAPANITVNVLPSIDVAIDTLSSGLGSVVQDIIHTGTRIDGVESNSRLDTLLSNAQVRTKDLLNLSGSLQAAETNNRLDSTRSNAQVRAQDLLNQSDVQTAASLNSRLSATLTNAQVRAQDLLNQTADRNTAEANSRLSATLTNAQVRAQDLVNQSGALDTRVSNETTIRSNADESLAQAINTLSARTLTRGNLQYNGGFEFGLADWTGDTAGWLVVDDPWGRSLGSTSVSGTGTLLGKAVPVFSSNTYSVTCDTRLFATSGAVYVDLQFYNSSGTLILDGASPVRSATHDFSTDNTGRKFLENSCVAPAGATAMRARLVWQSVTGVTYIGFRQVKLEAGGLPTTPYTTETTTTGTVAAVERETSARTTAIAAEALDRSTLASQMRGANLGSDLNALTEGLLFQERTTRAAQDNALSSQITLLSAGAGEQFDYKKIWYFDDGTEGWGGSNGTPTVTAGWIRPANGTDPFIISPDGINSEAQKYNQVRIRVRKTGAPVWDAQLFWISTDNSDYDFSESRSVRLAQPTYDAHGIGLITANPGWIGTLKRIRVDLSIAQTASDYFELDWIAIGRPSPGASSAQILEESMARIAADTAEATSRKTLSSKMLGFENPGDATLSTLSTGLLFESRTAQSSKDATIVSSISDLTATVGNNLTTALAAVNSESQARSAADSAETSRVDTLVSKLSTSPNLCPDVDKWELGSGYQVRNDGWGKSVAILNPSDGTYVCISPFISCYAGQTYTVTGDSLRYMTGGAVAFDMVFFNASGAGILYSQGNRAYNVHDYSNSNSNRDFHAVQCVAPAGASSVKIRFFVEGGSGISAAGFRQVKLEQRGLPATLYSQEGEISATSAAIKDEKDARVTAISAEATNRATLAAELRGKSDVTNAAVVEETRLRVLALSSEASTRTSLIAAINVGGANLMRNSGKFNADSVAAWNTNGSVITLDNTIGYSDYGTLKLTGLGGACNAYLMRLVPETEYTVSAMVKGTAAILGGQSTHLHIQVWTEENPTNQHQELGVSSDQNILTSWKKVYQTFKTPASGSPCYCRFFFYPLQNGFSLNIGYVKLELGNRATDWSIAADDLSAAFVEEKTARVNSAGAEVIARQQLAASLVTRPNLCPDVDKWTALGSVANDSWGKHVDLSNANGTCIWESPRMPSQAGAAFVVSGDSALFLDSGGSGIVYFDLIFFDNANNILLDGGQNPISVQHDFSSTNDTRNTHAVQAIAPANAATMIARFIGSSLVGARVIGFRQVKVERGCLPATSYTQEFSVDQLNAGLTLTNAAIVDERNTRVTAVDAEAEARRQLAATYSNNKTTTDAAIFDESTARAREDSAEAARRDVLEAKVNTNKGLAEASVQAETSARVTAVGSEASQRATLAATIKSGSGNQLFNPEFSVNTLGWGVGCNLIPQQTLFRNFNADWVVGDGTAFIHEDIAYNPAWASSGYSDVFSKSMPVKAGMMIEASAYTGAHRCRVLIYISFYNSTNAFIGAAYNEADANTVNNATALGGISLEGYKRLFAFGRVPAAASYCRLVVRKFHTSAGNSESYLFFTRAYLGEAAELQNTPSPYSPSGYTSDPALAAAIKDERDARVSADSAEATQRNTLAARVVSRANICPDVDKWNGDAVVGNSSWGIHAYAQGLPNGTKVFWSPSIPVQPNVTYTLTGDSLMFVNAGGGGNVYFDMVFLDSANNVLLDGGQNPISGVHDFSTDGASRITHAVQETAPVGSSYMLARFVAADLVNSNVIGFRQVKVERGGLPATVYTQEFSVQGLTDSVKSTNAAIVTASKVSSDATAAEAIKLAALTTAYNSNKSATDAAIVAEQIARSNAVSAEAALRNTLSASVQIRANICQDVDKWTALGSVAVDSWGKHVGLGNPSGTCVWESPRMLSQAGAAFVITGDSLLLWNAGGSGSVYFDLIFFDVSGNIVLDSTERPVSTQHDFSATNDTRLAHAFEVVAPSGADTMIARFVGFNLVNSYAIGFRQVKVERGNMPATPYTQENTVNRLADTAKSDKSSIDAAIVAAAHVSADAVAAEAYTRGQLATAFGLYKSATDAAIVEERRVSSEAMTSEASQRNTLAATVKSGSGNLLFNPEFANDISGWSVGNSMIPTQILERNLAADWTLFSGNTAFVNENLAYNPAWATNGYTDVYGKFVPVKEGTRVEASVYTGAHCCRVLIYIAFYNSYNNFIGAAYNENDAATVNNAETLGGLNLAGYKRLFILGYVPAGATTARITVRKFHTLPGYTRSYLFFTRAYLGEATLLQNSPSPYSPSGYTGDPTLTAAIKDERDARVSAMDAEVSQRNILTAKLKSGASNQIYNSEFAASLDGWGVSASITPVNEFGRNFNTDYTVGDGTAFIHETAAYNPAWASGFNDTYSKPVPITGGIRMEASIYAGAHRCRVMIYIGFYNVNGDMVSAAYNEQDTASTISTYTDGGKTLAGYRRLFIFGTAPASATQARLVLRKFHTSTGGYDSYAFFTRAYLAEAAELQNTPSPYSPSGYTTDMVTAASIRDERTARVNADNAEASLRLALSATLNTRPNICPDVDKWNGGADVTASSWGPFAYKAGLANGTYSWWSPRIITQAGANFVITGDSLLLWGAGGSGNVYFDMSFYDNSDNLLLDGDQNPISNAHDFSAEKSTRVTHSVQSLAPAGSSYMIARFVAENLVNSSIVGFRQVKVERGDLPTTAYTQESTVLGLTASIKVEAEVRASETGSLMTKYGVTLAAGNKVSGFRINNNSAEQSNFIILSDRFAVATESEGTTKYPFTVGTIDGVSSVGINGNMYVDGTIKSRMLDAESVTADKIKAGAITADKIQAGSISADKLSIGFGRNLLTNSTWLQRGGANGADVPKTWQADYNAPGSVFLATPNNHPSWVPVGMQGLDMNQQSGWTSGGSVMILTTFVSVEEWKRYEFSVYSGAHRCRIWTKTEWFDAWGNILNVTYENAIANDEQAAGGGSLNNYKRIGHFGTAPNNASRARFFIIKDGTKNSSGYQDSHAFLVAPMVAEAGPSQTVFSGYSPTGNGTKITGDGIETNSVGADHIIAGSITADRLAVGTITAASGIIGNLAVDTLQIAGNAVTVPASVSSSGSNVTLSYTIPGTPGDVYSVFILGSLTQAYRSTIYLFVDGVQIWSEYPIAGSLATRGVVIQLSVGTHSIQLYSDNGSNNHGCSIYALTTKR